MNRKIPILASVFAMLLMLLASTMPVLASDYKTEFTSPFVTKTPTIDGAFTTENEWADAAVTFWWFEPDSGGLDNYIYIYLMNTNTTLYVCLDIVPDNGYSLLDAFLIAIDENNDGEHEGMETSPDAEFWFSLKRDGTSIWSSYSDRAEVAYGFGESPSGALGGEDSDYDHTIVEMALPFTDFTFDDGTIGAGDTIGFYADGMGMTDPTWIFPTDATVFDGMGYVPEDAEDWAQVTLGEFEAGVTPTTEPVVSNHAKDIGIWLMVIGVIICLSAVAFRKELDNYYMYVIALGLIILAIGAINYVFEYIKTIPFILP